MNIPLLLIVVTPFLLGYFASRWISTQATQALETQHKIMLLDFSTKVQKYTMIWLILAFMPMFIFPGIGFFVCAVVVLIANWLTLKRLWAWDFPEAYKQKSLKASVIFTMGLFVSVILFYVGLYLMAQ